MHCLERLDAVFEVHSVLAQALQRALGLVRFDESGRGGEDGRRGGRNPSGLQLDLKFRLLPQDFRDELVLRLDKVFPLLGILRETRHRA